MYNYQLGYARNRSNDINFIEIGQVLSEIKIS